MPLHPEQHPLTPPDQQELNALLRLPGMSIFRRVVEAKANFVLAQAVESAYQSNAGDALVTQAQKKIDDAKRYRICLEVIDELKADQEHTEVRISTIKPKPTT
jgi:hypothetical protein